MIRLKDNAIVYCEGAFNTTNGKTAHGLVRFTKRYNVLAVVDSSNEGREAGSVLDGRNYNIPIVGSIREALETTWNRGQPATHLIVGIAPDGGRLNTSIREDIKQAISMGLNVDSGLHDFLSEDSELLALALEHDVVLRDVRKSPPLSELHFFTGDIEKVDAFKIAVLGTDSAVGKRTTAWKLVDGFEKADYRAEMIGTGQTAWLQGARYSIMLDALINDFVSGEIEHAVFSAWKERNPDVIVVEGQGSLMNPAYPGGFEILAAARPDVIVLQHAPARKEYDGFPGYRIHPLPKQIQALEMISGKPVVAVTINHEGLSRAQLRSACSAIEREVGLPAMDVLVNGADEVVEVLLRYLPERARRKSILIDTKS